MKCTKCQGEWNPPANISLNKCPFCQADILHMLNEQSATFSTEDLLTNIIKAYGCNVLQNQQRLAAIIADLFAHDQKAKRLLLLSVRENIPSQLLAITANQQADRHTRMLSIQHRLREDAFLIEEAALQIISLWTYALGWEQEQPDDSFQIVWQSAYCGFANAQGQMITPFKYDDARDFSEGLARVKLNGEYGFIDKQGREVIPLRYDDANSFSEGMAKVKLNEKYGYIDKQGKEVIPLRYDSAWDFSEGLAFVIVNQKYSYIDKQGN